MDAVLIFVAIAAPLWGLIYLVRGSLLASCLLTLLVGSCFGHPFWKATLGPAPITFDRLLMGLLVLSCFVQRRLGLVHPRPWRTADLVLGAFLSVLAVSTLTHDWQVLNYQPAMRLGIYYVMPVVLYWVARQASLSERSLRWSCAAIAVFGGYLALTAVAEVHGVYGLVFPRYIASPDFKEFFGRGRGPFLNPAACGIYQSLGWCAALTAWPRLNRGGQLGLAAAGLLYAVGIYSTLTRSVWAGAALALLVLGALTLPRSWRFVLLGGAVVVAMAVVAAKWESLLAFKRDRGLGAKAAAESVQLRPILAFIAWQMFLDRPVLGCGYGQYIQEHRFYLADRSTALPLEEARHYAQHNALLGLLAETGLVGAGLFTLLLAQWCRDAWRVWSNPGLPFWARRLGLLFLTLVAAWFPVAMFQDTGIIDMIHPLLFLMAGIAGGLLSEVQPSAAGANNTSQVGWAAGTPGMRLKDA